MPIPEQHDADLTDEDRETIGNAIAARLARMDGGARGAWTLDLLRLIAANEAMPAADLVARVGRDVVRFKGDVRRLKSMGLTDSLDGGYRLTDRGHALVVAADVSPEEHA